MIPGACERKLDLRVKLVALKQYQMIKVETMQDQSAYQKPNTIKE